MQLPQQKDAKHKAWLNRVLSAIYSDPFLAGVLYFKGGTCAAMLGLLDRFSVDLDFDFAGNKDDLPEAKKRMEKIFDELGMRIDDSSKRIPQYFLKYPAEPNERNTLKIDLAFPPVKANKYEEKRFSEIDRIITCQAPETMFGNKLMALVGRKRAIPAGRDVYDVHHFFMNGLRYDEDIIKERADQSTIDFFEKLIIFVEDKVTYELITRDLSTLLPKDKFRLARKNLKQETVVLLRDELERLKHPS